jgi:hypothetical protein
MRILRSVFGRRVKVRPPNSLAEALRRGVVPDEYLAQAMVIVNSYVYPRRPKTARPDPSWRDNNNPAWDNVVTALDEDR